TASVIITVDQTNSIQKTDIVPLTYQLHQNHPNPFNPTTQIQYDLPKASEVHLVVYDMLGKEVVLLLQQKQSAGRYQVTWNGKDGFGQQVSSGIYIYQLQARSFQQVRKMLLVR
ncbi:FlgD immunoglobulin-like domain containing protein, partial [bacterium]